MLRKMFALTLLGILLAGAATVAYGTSSGGSLGASLAALAGDEDEHGGHDDD